MYRFEGPFRTLHNPGYLYRFEGPFRGILNPLFYFNTYREGLTMNFVPRSTWFQPTRKEGREMTNRNGKIPTRSQNAPGACGGLGWHIWFYRPEKTGIVSGIEKRGVQKKSNWERVNWRRQRGKWKRRRRQDTLTYQCNFHACVLVFLIACWRGGGREVDGGGGKGVNCVEQEERWV